MKWIFLTNCKLSISYKRLEGRAWLAQVSEERHSHGVPYSFNQHSFGLPLRKNGIHRKQLYQARLDLLSLVTCSRVFWRSDLSRKTYTKHSNGTKRFDIRSLSPALRNLWLLLVYIKKLDRRTLNSYIDLPQSNRVYRDQWDLGRIIEKGNRDLVYTLISLYVAWLPLALTTD